MTDFDEKGGGHEQIRGFEELDTKATWSSFDDITWDDFGGDDHSVPDPGESVPAPWLRGGTSKKRDSTKTTAKEEIKMENPILDATTTMDVDNWDSLNMTELGTVPDNLNSLELKQEEADGLDLCLDGQAYNQEDASIVASSGHFSFSDVPTEDEMRIFTEDKGGGGTLMEYAWENIEDMDNLFQNEEFGGAQEAADALLQWPSSSSSPESDVSPELRAMKGKAHEQDVKMEFIPCESFDKSSNEVCTNNSEGDKVLEEQLVEPKAHKDKLSVGDTVEPVTSAKGKEPKVDSDKVHAKRQIPTRKRSEDRTKKPIYPKKPLQSMTHTKQTHYPPIQPLQLKPAVTSTLQVYPQVIGTVVPPPILPQRPQYMQHSGMGTAHHSPYLIQGQQSQPVMMCYDPERQQYEQQKIEILAPPPVSGTNMTPQEKIEKLRWKQKMQKLASEQQITKQCIPLDKQHEGKLKQIVNSKNTSVKTEESEGRVVEAAVLNQLLGIMSKLDVGTRICIRDALYRLARSAMNRHASDGTSSSEGSNSSPSDKNINRAIRYPMLETETNPIDRTIANLLFHKRSTGSTLALPNTPTATYTWQQQQSSLETASGRGESIQQPKRQAVQESQHERMSEQNNDFYGENAVSDGSSKRPKPLDLDKLEVIKTSDAKTPLKGTPRSGLKREASCDFGSTGYTDEQ